MALAWKARWISYGQHPADDLGVFLFRKKFQSARGSKLTVMVSADQRYRLYVNGHIVGGGPQRGDLQYWFFETYDIGGHLVYGENTIVAVVWNFGRYAPMAQHTYRTAFVLEGEGVSTPNGWEVARKPGHEFEMMHGEVGPFYIDVGPGEAITQLNAEPEWHKPNDVSHVLLRGEWAGDSPWNLVPRTLPDMRREEWKGRAMVVDRSSNERQPFDSLMVHPGEKVLIDFGELLAAYPTFRLDGSPGASVKVTYGEGLFDKDNNKGDRNDVRGKRVLGYQDRFILGDPVPRSEGYGSSGHPQMGGTGFETLWWRTWRYLQLEADQPVRLESVGVTETGYPYEVESSFDGSDPWIEKIWNVAVRTAKRCAGETYFDCPYYEQLQYVGDTRIQTLINYYVSRDRRLARNAVEQFVRSILPEGLTQSRYPSRVVQIIPTFSLWWLQMVGDQHAYDDGSLLQSQSVHLDEVFKGTTRWIAEGPEHWPFSDWVDGWSMGIAPGGRASTLVWLLWVMSTLTYMGLRRSAKGESLPIEKSRDLMVEAATELSEGLRRHRGDKSWKPSEHIEALYRLVQTARGHKPEAWPTEALARAHADKTTLYFSYYKHLAMAAAGGESFDYLAQLGPWKRMIEDGLTTFAEKEDPVRSDCHAWSAHPILGFLQIVAGVTSAAPGWKRAKIEPRPGALKEFNAKIAHTDGDLTVRWNGSKFQIDSPVPFTFVWRGKSQEATAGRHSFG